MQSLYGYIEIPKSEYRYFDLPESEKVRKKRRRRRRNTRSTAENSLEGVTIIEGNNTVRVNKKTNEPKKKVANPSEVTEEIFQQQTKHSLYRKPKKLEINTEWNGGKTLSNWDYESNKLLNSTN